MAVPGLDRAEVKDASAVSTGASDDIVTVPGLDLAAAAVKDAFAVSTGAGDGIVTVPGLNLAFALIAFSYLSMFTIW